MRAVFSAVAFGVQTLEAKLAESFPFRADVCLFVCSSVRLFVCSSCWPEVRYRRRRLAIKLAGPLATLLCDAAAMALKCRQAWKVSRVARSVVEVGQSMTKPRRDTLADHRRRQVDLSLTESTHTHTHTHRANPVCCATTLMSLTSEIGFR